MLFQFLNNTNQNQFMKILGFLGFALPLTSSAMGYEVLLFLAKKRLSIYELVGISFPFGVAITSFISIIINLFFQITPLHFIIEVLLSFLIFSVFFKLNQKKNNKPLIKKYSIYTYIILFAELIFFSYIIIMNTFNTKGNIIFSAENDLLHEISLISSFRRGCNKGSNIFTGILCPLFESRKIISEAPSALYQSLLTAGGFSIKYAILIPTLLLFYSSIILQFCLTWRLSHSEIGSLLSSVTIFMISGYGFRYFINTNSYKNKSLDFVFFLDQGVFNSWGHPLIHCFLTSRPILFSLSFSIFSYVLLEAGLTHLSFLFVMITLLFRKQSGLLLMLIFILYPANLPLKFYLQKLKYYLVLIIVIFIFAFANNSISLAKNPMWLISQSQKALFPFIQYIYDIFGMAFPSFLLFLLMRESKQEINPDLHKKNVQKPVRIPTISKAILVIIIFYIQGIFQTQPNTRFNFFSDLSTLVPLISALFAGATFKAINSFFPLTGEMNGIMTSLMIITILSTWISTLCGLHQKKQQFIRTWSHDEKEVSDWVVKNTKRSSVFVSPRLVWWNPAIILAGRISYTTSQEALQFFDFDFSKRNGEVSSWANGNGNLSQKHDYIIYEIDVDEKFHSFVQPQIGSNYSLVFTNSKYSILKWA